MLFIPLGKKIVNSLCLKGPLQLVSVNTVVEKTKIPSWCSSTCSQLQRQAFDCWEQLGGGSTCGPLCQFTMQPIGKRCHWRNVLEQAQFTAQLRQFRDPVAGDNIGVALTKAFHIVIEAELQ